MCNNNNITFTAIGLTHPTKTFLLLLNVISTLSKVCKKNISLLKDINLLHKIVRLIACYDHN